MMVFQAKGQGPFKLRVRDKAGRAGTFSTGQRDRSAADSVEAMVKQWRKDHRWVWLALIVSKAVTLSDAYDAYAEGRLAELMTEAHVRASDTDLEPYVGQWERAGANATYVRQVRGLIPAGERFGLSRFRRKEIKAFTDRLTVGNATKRKYLVALSMFAKWLIEQEVIESNPTRDITLAAPVRPHKWKSALTPEEAKRVILSQVGEQRALEALMFGSMAEWQACERLHRRDIDLDRRLVWAHGTKTERFGDYRDRWIEVTEDWCWEILAEWVKGMLPDARVFQSPESVALRRHKAACKRLGIRPTTLHQYRHTFAAMWIERGAAGGLRPDRRDMPWLRNQAGHAPTSTLMETTYGVTIRRVKLAAQQDAATKPATTTRKGMR